jgi:tetratricopeptide (TPR) repeat protein
LAETGDFNKALETTGMIEDQSYKVSALTKITGRLIEAEQNEQAKEILSQALETAKEIKTEQFRGLALEEIIVIQAGDFNNVLEVAKTIKSDYSLRSIVIKLAEVGDFNKALEATDMIEDQLYKVSALSKIAVKLAEAGHNEKAKEILSQALELIRTLNYRRDQASALSEVAGKFFEIGMQPSESDKVILRDILDMIVPMNSFW